MVIGGSQVAGWSTQPDPNPEIAGDRRKASYTTTWGTIQEEVNVTLTPHKRVPWNKGKLTGAKPPLRPKHVWSIRTKLQIEGRARDLAMFNLAIDSKLRGCDVVAIRVEDVAAGGYTADRAIVRRAVLDFFRVRCSGNRSGDPIVAGKRPNSYAINYPELKAWIEMAHRPLIEVNDSARG